MISSEVTLVQWFHITVNRSIRHRSTINPTKVAEIADSIQRMGLIHPILVSPEMVLIAGEHRLEAFKYLHEKGAECSQVDYEGWSLIPIHFAHDVTPAELLALELEENIKRTDMCWQDQVKAVRKYHDTRTAMNSNWAAVDTARAIGMAPGSVSKYLQIAREIEEGNELILASSGIGGAVSIMERARDRAVSQELESLAGAVAKPKDVGVPEASCIICTDFTKWAPLYEGPRFNLIHCDFPYGINWDKSRASDSNPEWRSSENLYDDSPELYWTLIDTLLNNIDRLMMPSAHIMFWFSMKNYHETMNRFQDAGFWVFPFPLIWHKSDNLGIPARPDLEPKRTYETALLMSRGNRNLVVTGNASFASPTTKEIHTSEKPMAVLRHFMKMLVDQSSIVLDPTCGSGTSIRVAEELGATWSLGLEISDNYAAKAIGALKRYRGMRGLTDE